MGQGGITGDNSVSSASKADASVAAYGPSGAMSISYGKPVTLAGLFGDTKSLLIAGALALLAFKLMRHKKG